MGRGLQRVSCPFDPAPARRSGSKTATGSGSRAHRGGTDVATAPQTTWVFWQITKVNWKSFGGRDALYDADTNAGAAYSLSSRGKSFKAWNVFKNGSYKKFLTEAQQAVDSAKCDATPDGGQIEDSQPPVGE